MNKLISTSIYIEQKFISIYSAYNFSYMSIAIDMKLSITCLGWISLSTAEIKYFQFYHFAYLLPPALHS